MSHICRRCGEECVPVPPRKLSDWEIRELARRANAIRDEWPARPWRRSERWSRLQNLAGEYGITVRTLYRYLEKAA